MVGVEFTQGCQQHFLFAVDPLVQAKQDMETLFLLVNSPELCHINVTIHTEFFVFYT